MNEFIKQAQKVIEIESQAISALKHKLGEGFIKACESILDCTGRVVVLGMGKSSHIGAKIAATLASTGTPAFFVHAGEASHGDLGMITPHDVVIAISNSGETSELIAVIPIIKHLGVTLIALCGRRESSLSLASDILIEVSVTEEACPLGLAPTASTTAALVIGDALAVALLKARDFTPADFARTHPSGNLGRRLMLTVGDLMHVGEELPLIYQDQTLAEGLYEITRKKLGVTMVINQDKQVLGIFTDGDLRRVLDRKLDINTVTMAEVMTPGGKMVKSTTLATEALLIMEKHKITSLIILNDERRPLGLIHMHDLLRAGVA